MLPPAQNESEPGPVRWETRPYLRQPLDSLEEPGITDVIFVAPTRSGKTFLLRMGMSCSIAKDPAPALFVDSTMDKGRGFIRKEFKPLVEYNRILRDQKPLNRHYFADGMMLFPGAALTVFGANSDAQVSGETVKRIFGNEVDKWRGSTDQEASILDQTRHRTESFEDERIHYYSSTPTLESGLIWQEFLKGDQRKWFVPCPCCGHMQDLVWPQVDWAWHPETRNEDGSWDMEKVRELVRYRCRNSDCKGEPWTQEQLWAAVRDPRSDWIATAVGRFGHRSYHINGLYGPLKVNTMAALASDFIYARKTAFFTDRQDFWNGRMGMPWVDDVNSLSASKFADFEGDYLRGTLPESVGKADLIIVGFDVQTYGLPFLVLGFTWDGHCYTIDHGLAATFSDLDEVQGDYAHLGKLSYVIGDINFEDRAAETREAIYLRRERGWMAAEGFEVMREPVKFERANAFIGGRHQKRGARFPKLMISLYMFKIELEKRLAGEIRKWSTYGLSLVASDSEVKEQAEYYAQLLDERRVPRKRKLMGKPPFEFKSRNGNNHFWDCYVYALGLFYFLSRSKSAKKKGKRSTATVEQK
ncbi:terminase [Cerasicoccus arenae]|uniref:Terminase n=1 Tax=Cerasicoccus arenae TaxID=424488 RepID=A0A8J3DC88_9BACT|nr:terminase [Cerasicoccus arenae]